MRHHSSAYALPGVSHLISCPATGRACVVGQLEEGSPAPFRSKRQPRAGQTFVA